jgi:hypothetical protein
MHTNGLNTFNTGPSELRTDNSTKKKSIITQQLAKAPHTENNGQCT